MLRARAVRPGAARHRDAGDGRLPGARAAEADPHLRDLPVIVTSAVGGLDSVVALHRAGRRGLPDQAGEPGAAEGAHRLPAWRRSACATSSASWCAASPPPRWPRTWSSPASRWAASSCRGHGDVLRHPRLHHAWSESQAPDDTIELLNTYYTLMFDAISGHGGVVNQMVGDGLMAIFGAPLPLADHVRQRRARRAGDDRDDRAVQPGAATAAASPRSASASASPRAR